MSRRVIFAVSLLLFGLLSFVARVLVDVHDQTYPASVGATSSVFLDFSQSGLSDEAAFAAITSESRRLRLHMFKVQPNMGGEQRGQSLVTLGVSGFRPGTTLPRFGNEPPLRILDGTALSHSFATGAYLVTESTGGLTQFERKLEASGVRVNREDDSVVQMADFAFKQGTFRIALVAIASLMTSMALFWLVVRARGRALRVLGGVPAARIQTEDLGAFLLTVAAAAIPPSLVSIVATGLHDGWTFVPFYAGCLFWMVISILGVTFATALLISCASWPSPLVLARREPPVQNLHRASNVLKAVTFLLLVGAVGPAWTAFKDASGVAAQQAQWKSLADEVAFRYPQGLGEKGFVRIRDSVGRAVSEADASGAAALSYAMTPDQLGLPTFGNYDTVALVNPAWLELMLTANQRGALTTIPAEELPGPIARALTSSLRLWKPVDSAVPALASFHYLRADDDADLPLAQGGSGDLVFPRRALLVVVEKISNTFGADFLASLTSSSNLVFSGLDPTVSLLRKAGLESTIRVVYVAEDGILRAQYTAHEAWLRAMSGCVLAAAFAIAAAVSSLIAAMLSLRRDFPMRVAGRAWLTIVAPRIMRESLAGGLLVVGLISVQPLPTLPAACAAALIGLLVAAALQIAAARWCFANVGDRRI